MEIINYSRERRKLTLLEKIDIAKTLRVVAINGKFCLVIDRGGHENRAGTTVKKLFLALLCTK